MYLATFAGHYGVTGSKLVGHCGATLSYSRPLARPLCRQASEKTPSRDRKIRPGQKLFDEEGLIRKKLVCRHEGTHIFDALVKALADTQSKKVRTYG